jgi:hypothetical protein
VQVGLRSLSRVLLDRTFFVPEDQADRAHAPEARAALAEVLTVVATALRRTSHPPSAPGDGSPEEAIEATLQGLKSSRDRLAARLMVDPAVDPAAWAQHGALLDAVDRLRVEAEAALRPSYVAWSPPPLAERQRQVMRQAMNAATTARRRVRLPWRPRENP